MKAKTEFISKELRYALGQDLHSGFFYASFPVTNGIADYQEYYKISDEQYAQFLADPDAALAFVDACRQQDPEHDVLLLQKPGSNRGIPRL